MCNKPYERWANKISDGRYYLLNSVENFNKFIYNLIIYNLFKSNLPILSCRCFKIDKTICLERPVSNDPGKIICTRFVESRDSLVFKRVCEIKSKRVLCLMWDVRDHCLHVRKVLVHSGIETKC